MKADSYGSVLTNPHRLRCLARVLSNPGASRARRNAAALATLLVALLSAAEAESWTTKAPMPSGRGEVAVGVVGGVLYAVGGMAGSPGAVGPRATLEAYDPATNTWTQRAPMPTVRSLLGVGTLNGVLYAIGGLAGDGSRLATVEAYDPATDTWTTKAPMPTARGLLAIGVANGVLYAVGGYDGGILATVEAYDPAGNTWSARAPMPTPRYGLAVGVANGVLYAVGGYNGGVLATVEAYDSLTNTWTSRAPMLTPRSRLGDWRDRRSSLRGRRRSGALIHRARDGGGVRFADQHVDAEVAHADREVWPRGRCDERCSLRGRGRRRVAWGRRGVLHGGGSLRPGSRRMVTQGAGAHRPVGPGGRGGERRSLCGRGWGYRRRRPRDSGGVRPGDRHMDAEGADADRATEARGGGDTACFMRSGGTTAAAWRRWRPTTRRPTPGPRRRRCRPRGLASGLGW